MWIVCAVWVGVRNVALVHSWWNLGVSLPTLLSILSPVWANFLIKANADGYGVPAGVKAGAANSSPTLHTLSACFSIFHSSLYFTCVGSEAVNTSNAMRLLADDVTRPALSYACACDLHVCISSKSAPPQWWAGGRASRMYGNMQAHHTYCIQA